MSSKRKLPSTKKVWQWTIKEYRSHMHIVAFIQGVHIHLTKNLKKQQELHDQVQEKNHKCK